MTRLTQILTIIAGLIYFLSFFFPSRLASYDLGTISDFAKIYAIGYSPYIMLLFPILYVMLLFNRIWQTFKLSIILILINNGSFENALDFFVSNSEFSVWGFLSRVLPYLTLIVLLIWLVTKSLKAKKWTWYFVFIAATVVSYLWFNDANCTILFVSDIGIKKNDLELWFTNCGTYYAWWSSPIIFNIGLFYQIRMNNCIDDKGRFKWVSTLTLLELDESIIQRDN